MFSVGYLFMLFKYCAHYFRIIHQQGPQLFDRTTSTRVSSLFAEFLAIAALQSVLMGQKQILF